MKQMFLLMLTPVLTTTFSPKQQPFLMNLMILMSLRAMNPDSYLAPEACVEAANMESFLEIALKRAR